MSVPYLKEALASGETDKLLRFVRLHLGDGDEAAGRREIDKAWVEALKILLEAHDGPAGPATPGKLARPTDRDFILETVKTRDPATLAHLFFQLHFYLVKHSGAWIHDGNL